MAWFTWTTWEAVKAVAASLPAALGLAWRWIRRRDEKEKNRETLERREDVANLDPDRIGPRLRRRVREGPPD